MIRSQGRAGGLIERAVAEAIDAVAAPSVREQVIGRALRRARRSSVPERGPSVAAFVQGPLFDVLVSALGEPAATSVRDELAAVAARVAGEVSPLPPSWPGVLLDDDDDDAEGTRAQPPAATDPAPRRELPLLVVASSSPIALSMLSVALGGAAYIEAARDALALAEGLVRHDPGALVLDCRNPTVRIETLLAMQPELPAELPVVLWGEPPDLERRLARLGVSVPGSWVRCGFNASADDLAAVCRVLLG